MPYVILLCARRPTSYPPNRCQVVAPFHPLVNDSQSLFHSAPLIVGGTFRVEKKLGEGSFGSLFFS